MNRNQFNQAAAQQNTQRAAEVIQARATGAACSITTMFALGGVDYCTTHRVMGTCPYGQQK